MICGDGLVTHVSTAVFAYILTDTGSSAGCFLQCRIKNCYMSIFFCGNFDTFIYYFAAYRAYGLAGKTSSVTSRSYIFNCFGSMSLCTFSKLTFKRNYLSFAAVFTSLLNAGSVYTVCFNYITIYPCMAECFGFLSFGVIAAAALESVKTTLVTGCCYICFVGSVKLHIVTERLASFYHSGFALCTADRALFANLCRFITSCFDSSLFHVVFFILFIPSIIA